MRTPMMKGGLALVAVILCLWLASQPSALCFFESSCTSSESNCGCSGNPLNPGQCQDKVMCSENQGGFCRPDGESVCYCSAFEPPQVPDPT